jgi:hypothetical protein
MRWKEHVQQAARRATKTVLGMSGLRHLRPAQMRQIYQACVLPKLDYASRGPESFVGFMHQADP